MADRPQNKLQFSYFSEKVGFHSKWFPCQDQPSIGSEVTKDPRGFLYSADGRYLAIKTPTHVSILSTENMQEISQLKMIWVSHLIMSPKSSFVATWTPADRAGGPDVENLGLWNLKTGEKLFGWHLNRKPSWPLIQWSFDEMITGVLSQVGKVNFYAGLEFKTAVQTITVPGLTQFFMGPGKVTNIGIFVPDKGSNPGSVMVYEYPKLTKEIMQKVSCFADSIEVLWNDRGDGMLLLVTKDVDADNYYGKKGLIFVNVGTKFFARVTDEYVHDVQWNPNSTEFACIYGAMPFPKVSLFNMKCTKTADLVNGEEARNKLLYDPYGRILCVGGFGSLNGDMDFWDLTKQDLKKVGRANAFSASHQEWCPDSKHIMACVVSPRMKMDNGIKIFNYHGELVHEEKVPELYQVHWRPFLKGTFPQKEVEAPKKLTTGPALYRHPHAAAAPVASSGGRGSGPVRYTPPGAGQPRQVVGCNPVANRVPVGGGAVVGGPPVPQSKNAKKNAKKRAAKAAAKNEGESTGTSAENQGEQ